MVLVCWLCWVDVFYGRGVFDVIFVYFLVWCSCDVDCLLRIE